MVEVGPIVGHTPAACDLEGGGHRSGRASLRPNAWRRGTRCRPLRLPCSRLTNASRRGQTSADRIGGRNGPLATEPSAFRPRSSPSSRPAKPGESRPGTIGPLGVDGALTPSGYRSRPKAPASMPQASTPVPSLRGPLHLRPLHHATSQQARVRRSWVRRKDLANEPLESARRTSTIRASEWSKACSTAGQTSRSASAPTDPGPTERASSRAASQSVHRQERGGPRCEPPKTSRTQPRATRDRSMLDLQRVGSKGSPRETPRRMPKSPPCAT